MNTALAGSSTETSADNPLVIGGTIATNKGTLITGQNLTAGTVLGRITASGKLTKAVQAAETGQQKPVGILAHDYNAAAADAICQYYYSGEFNSANLVWEAGFTAALQASAFDGTPIAVKTLA